MLILRKLLFMPLLSCMDARRQKIENAVAIKAQKEEKLKAEIELADKKELEQYTLDKTEADRKVAQEHTLSEQKIEHAVKKAQASENSYEAELEAEKTSCKESADLAVCRLSELFVSKFVS